MYSRNWLTVDGLWFSGVEEKFGLYEALDLNVRRWEIGSRIEVNLLSRTAFKTLVPERQLIYFSLMVKVMSSKRPAPFYLSLAASR
jgi:hypothetical protein